MDPHFEQRLRDEVIYLHSLWHKGPPTTNRPPDTHPNRTHNRLPPSNPTQFKKERKNPKPRRSKKLKNQKPPPAEVSDMEWPWESIPDPSPTDPPGWTSFPQRQQNADPHSPSPSEKAWIFANQSQSKALEAVKEFFRSENSDSDVDDGEDDSEIESIDEDEGLEEKTKQDDNSGFFAKLFEGDGELRDYYLKNYENGEFSCLACGGVGKIKRFKDCVALVQHTITIAKTRKRKAHREYGKVICKVLNWDIDKLPSIVRMISEKRNVASGNSGEPVGEKQADLGDGTNDVVSDVVSNLDSATENNEKESRGEESIGNVELHGNGALAVVEETLGDSNTDAAHKVLDNVVLVNECKDEAIQGKESIDAEKFPENDESRMSEQNFQIVTDAGTSAQALNKDTLEMVQGRTKSASNCMEPHKEEAVDGGKAEDNQNNNAAVDDLKENENQNHKEQVEEHSLDSVQCRP